MFKSSSRQTNTWRIGRMPMDAVSTRSIQIWVRCASVCERWAKETAPTHHHPGLTIFCLNTYCSSICVPYFTYVLTNSRVNRHTSVFSMIFRHHYHHWHNTHCAQLPYLIIWLMSYIPRKSSCYDSHRKAFPTTRTHSHRSYGQIPNINNIFCCFKHFTIHKPTFYYTIIWYALRSQDAAHNFYPLCHIQTHRNPHKRHRITSQTTWML